MAAVRDPATDGAPPPAIQGEARPSSSGKGEGDEDERSSDEPAAS